MVRSANPQSVEALRQMASTCVALAEETTDTDRRVELMKRAKKYYQWSLSLCPKDPQVRTLFFYRTHTHTRTRTCHRTHD